MDRGFLRVGAANPEIRVADTEFNTRAVIKIIDEAYGEGLDVLVFPELCVTGYTCSDLFFKAELIAAAEKALCDIAAHSDGKNMLVFVGAPVRKGGKLYNCAVAIKDGSVLGVVPKINLPEYGEFNELRFFASGAGQSGEVSLCGAKVPFGQMLFCADNVSIGAEICEDLWAASAPSGELGALVAVNLSASSETAGKAEKRRALVKSQSLRSACAYIYADAGRGESSTDLVFAGHSIIAEKSGILAENKPFGNNVLTVADIDTDYLLFERARINTVRGENQDALRVNINFAERKLPLKRNVSKQPFVPDEKNTERAELILSIQSEGQRKRMEHTGLKKLVLGVSGGLDSALALLVCLRTLDALNLPRKNLVAVSMPGFGTSDTTAQNALLLAKESKADHRIIDIKPSVTQHLHDIGHDMSVLDAAYENAQARMRTLILMDIANREGGIAVGTGDLSEAALGWCTYGGDHMSMYSVNASVPKTLVKFLVKYEAERIGGKTENALRGVLATEISPELLPAENGKIAQKTEDIIGSYEINDFFLYYAVKCGCSPEKTLMYAAAAFGGAEKDYRGALARFYKRFFASQFKRSCSPDGAKIGFSFSPRGDWRMPSDASVKLWIDETEK